ncbi:flavin reductase family protein [Paraburkholderia guartelaensis]|uniref:flavin reductase family protein n=1 Tax=Paraburkholderia guartelaensis TaxID=2546446 RepID=UPI002AB7DBF1|nr:flavin reductase family protein [Paraburkholderia guartelaensis]
MGTVQATELTTSSRRIASESQIDKQHLKDAFSRVPAGVVVVTSRNSDGELAGATVSSFSSLSFDPPLISLALSQRSKTLSAIVGHGHFAVHVVAEPQRSIAMWFASDVADKFDSVDYSLSADGVPLLKQFETALQCKLESAQSAGDHQLLIARILQVDLSDQDSAPVAWLRRGFHMCEQLPVHA